MLCVSVIMAITRQILYKNLQRKVKEDKYIYLFFYLNLPERTRLPKRRIWLLEPWLTHLRGLCALFLAEYP